MEQYLTWNLSLQSLGHAQGPLHQIGVLHAIQRSALQPAGTAITHRTQVEPALIAPQIGDV